MAKQLSERFGNINQIKENLSVNATDTSFSRSTQLGYTVPASTVSCLSSGEFVGMVADDPTTPISLKTFHCRIQNDHEAIPEVRNVSTNEILSNYQRIKADIQELVAALATD
ncbi:MAG: hypothetical protein J0H85_03565 [Sediminibacterium magnilacihabitans]|jgi:hypothetical protein|nr:hypothetical protein [Sediminibacterium magnilacihabitans]PQV62029.1 hypothetical protein CLV53_101304 [Sediminibacterium magnilacihabitans]